MSLVNNKYCEILYIYYYERKYHLLYLTSNYYILRSILNGIKITKQTRYRLYMVVHISSVEDMTDSNTGRIGVPCFSHHSFQFHVYIQIPSSIMKHQKKYSIHETTGASRGITRRLTLFDFYTCLNMLRVINNSI